MQRILELAQFTPLLGILILLGATGVRAPERQVGIGVCLDRTFQDAGRWLVKVIDEDPIWRWNPPGSQFCKKIDGIVVLSGDMM